MAYHAIIFSHDFAKAFWKNETMVKDMGEENYISRYILLGKDLDPMNPSRSYIVRDYPSWGYHLQQMVLEKYPLQYLAKFLEDK